MGGRTRTRSAPSTGIYRFKVNGVQSGSDATDFSSLIFEDKCIDVTGTPNADHVLSISHFDTSGWDPISGIVGSGAFAGSGYYSPWYAPSNTEGKSHLTLDFGSTGADITKAIARTNPSRPGVTPLTLVQDLVELPKMLKDVGKLIKAPKRLLSSREIANQNLAIRFGWLPLIKDIQDLLNLQQSIHQRADELNRLYSETGLHRRISLGKASNSSQKKNFSISSFSGVSLNANISKETKAERWASVRWKPTSAPPFNPSDHGRIQQARKLVSGMTVEGMMNGLWEVIPWTWIVDWFTDVHGYAMAHSNTVPATPYSCCVMQHTKTKTIFDPISTGSAAAGGGGTVIYETKERFIGGASVNAFLPFIGEDRLSILGSLFIQRFKR